MVSAQSDLATEHDGHAFPDPVVEIEENVYSYEPPNNGAFPFWCWGSTCIALSGSQVFVSGLETLKGVEPLNNVRWLLFERTARGWQLQQRDEQERTREPCPLAAFPDGRLWLSANPVRGSLPQNNPAEPLLLEFSVGAVQSPYRTWRPPWEEHTRPFTEHSYRGLAADGPNRELLLLNILGYDKDYWAFLDRDGRWSARGTLTFPWSREFNVSLRLCYPVVALSNRAAHIFAVSDIVEPVQEWKEFKFALTQRQWDYAFRRLYYTWTPDITREPFSPWLEVANQERTAGHTTNLDLWVAPDGAAHLLWLERTLDVRLRDRFFPGEQLTTSLEYAVIRRGQIASRRTLVKANEGAAAPAPLWGRLHATREDQLLAFYSLARGESQPASAAANLLMNLSSESGSHEAAEVRLAQPFGPYFMTATERGGSPPSRVLHVLGLGSDQTVRYSRINLGGTRN